MFWDWAPPLSEGLDSSLNSNSNSNGIFIVRYSLYEVIGLFTIETFRFKDENDYECEV